jgi:hypothetical protein
LIVAESDRFNGDILLVLMWELSTGDKVVLKNASEPQALKEEP